MYSFITAGHVLHDRRRRAGLADNIFLGLFAVHEVDARLSHLWLDADYFRCAYGRPVSVAVARLPTLAEVCV